MRETSHLASCIGSNILLYACATGTSAWSNELSAIYRRLFGCFVRREKQQEKVQPKKALINSDGQQIGFEPNQERQIHFSQMAIMWNKPTVH